MDIKNAVIKDASINITKRKELLVYLYLRLENSEKYLGAITFVGSNEPDSTGNTLFKLLMLTGVDNWNDIIGKAVRVRFDGEKVKHIGHIIGDVWLDFSELTANAEKQTAV